MTICRSQADATRIEDSLPKLMKSLDNDFLEENELKKEEEFEFVVINMDGYNLGVRSCFGETFMEFEDLEEAIQIAKHWEKWIRTGK